MDTPGKFRELRKPSLKARLRKREATVGSWITLGHPAIAEIMARSGFDWLAVDLEHSVVTLREAEELIRVIEFCGVAPLVRLSANDPIQIKRVMDAGAHGVIVPMVNSRQEAEQAVQAVRYPPLGRRGVGLARAQGYGTRFNDYKEWLEKESVIIVQVEHVKAVANLSDILGVEGVDGFLVGPYDLSGSLGVPGQLDHPSVVEALREVMRVAGKQQAVAGYHVVQPQPELALEKLREGYRFIGYGVDFLFLGEFCRQGVRTIRSGAERS